MRLRLTPANISTIRIARRACIELASCDERLVSSNDDQRQPFRSTTRDMDEAPLAVLSRAQWEYQALQGDRQPRAVASLFSNEFSVSLLASERNSLICRHRCSAKSRWSKAIDLEYGCYVRHDDVPGLQSQLTLHTKFYLILNSPCRSICLVGRW